MIDYLCTNSRNVRFTIRSADADSALSRAITQFSIHGHYHAPIIASNPVDPNDYKSSEILTRDFSAYEQEVKEALDSFSL